MNLRRFLEKFRRSESTSVFIHSAPHSGSTWLGYVLGSGPETAFVGELYRAWSDTDRVPCTICAARGLHQCALLGGIENVDPKNAFAFISSRNYRRIIVENSKRLDWTERFVGHPSYTNKIIHLVQDPRNVWASVRRRGGTDLDGFLASWSNVNQEIAEFSRIHHVPTKTVVYDVVAAQPELEMQNLFDFIGARFERSVMQYWKVEHHGYAANGASSQVISHHQLASPPPHYATGDDQFYKGVLGNIFLDQRWIMELPASEKAAIVTNVEAQKILEAQGYCIHENGIDRLS